jgi:ABC-type microcin C transport system permease subunit YejE
MNAVGKLVTSMTIGMEIYLLKCISFIVFPGLFHVQAIIPLHKWIKMANLNRE